MGGKSQESPESLIEAMSSAAFPCESQSKPKVAGWLRAGSGWCILGRCVRVESESNRELSGEEVGNGGVIRIFLALHAVLQFQLHVGGEPVGHRGVDP